MEDGTIYRISLDGVLTRLHSFSGPDGNFPHSNLIEATDGNFYGATAGGGANGSGFGSLFRMSPTGLVATVYSLTGTDDGEFPYNNLLQAGDGNLYGVTSRGENNTGSVFFESSLEGNYQGINFTGTLSTVYASSTNLSEDGTGHLYGVIGSGGTTGNGEIFSVKDGVVDDVANIPSGGDGGIPYAGLLLATDGNLYGTEYGYFTDGGLFAVTPAGAYRALPTFDGTNGASPFSSLIQGADGNFYGNTSAGGSSGEGTLFKLTPPNPLPAPVQVSITPASVAAGTTANLSWQVINAYSDTMQQCYAFVQDHVAGAGSWTGLQTGELSGEYYSGSTGIVPTEPGQYTYALTCGGVASGTATLTVTGAAKVPSLTTLTAAPSSLVQGSVIGLTANVANISKKNRSAKPTGTVLFHNGQQVIGEASVGDNGKATLTASTGGIPAANYLVWASYAGDTNFAPSNSGDVDVNLQAQTATLLSVSPSPLPSGATATLLAVVSQKSGHQLPTGVVNFYYRGRVLGQSTLIDGQTTWVQSTQGLAAGSYPVTAVYAGDAGNAASAGSLVISVTN
jgi:uncharacterized repeat protein (TIGR03803 family)